MKEKLKNISMVLKQNWLHTLIIVIATLAVWHPLLGQTLLGEGYYYFDRQQDFVNNEGQIADIWQTDMLGKILFDLLPPVFGPNTQLYLGFQLLTMISLHITFYIVLCLVTKAKSLSLLSTIFFTTSYIGQFEMLGTGNYQRFVQRVPNLIIGFTSLICLHDYLVTNKKRMLALSYCLFAFAMFLAHFTTFLLPLFFYYLLFHILLTKKQKLFRILIIFVPYVVLTWFFIRNDHLTPNTNPVTFIQTQQSIITNVFLQYSSLLTPTFVIDIIAKVSNPFTDTLIVLALPLIFLFNISYFLIPKRHTQYRALFLTFIACIPTLLFLNVFLGKVDPTHNISGYRYYFLPPDYIGEPLISSVKGDRYYFVPLFFISFIVSSFTWLLAGKYKKFRLVIYSIFFAICCYNSLLIRNSFGFLSPFILETKNYTTYMHSLSSTFKHDSIIAAPQHFLWPSSMIRNFWGYPDMRFVDIKRVQSEVTTGKSIIYINYDKSSKKFSNYEK